MVKLMSGQSQSVAGLSAAMQAQQCQPAPEPAGLNFTQNRDTLCYKVYVKVETVCQCQHQPTHTQERKLFLSTTAAEGVRAL